MHHGNMDVIKGGGGGGASCAEGETMQQEPQTTYVAFALPHAKDLMSDSCASAQAEGSGPFDPRAACVAQQPSVHLPCMLPPCRAASGRCAATRTPHLGGCLSKHADHDLQGAAKDGSDLLALQQVGEEEEGIGTGGC